MIHLEPAERTALDDARAEYERMCQSADGLSEPACWSWPLPPGLSDLGAPDGLSGRELQRYEDRAEDLLRGWQDGRCAVCGRQTEVTDHDHVTGLIRGRLCRPCNAAEGKGYGEVFAKYRERNPATILGIRVRYYSPFSGYAKPVHVDPDADLAMRAELANMVVDYFADSGQGG
jgi:hypothetical protein